MADKDELWKKAKRVCRLNLEDIALAKSLGLNPKGLMKNVPNSKEKWKLPVKEWIHYIDESRQRKALQKKKRKEKAEKDRLEKEEALKDRLEKENIIEEEKNSGPIGS
ncbi:MAG: hypothetical protein LBE38_03320 [Deltaproteobacteria bacterium]|jgi:hypothetical protein|nr:hypothetical protein [Deltaproteobacteria bacterium]